MSSVHNPKQKKQLAYERDHYAKSKYDKARNGWRIKKQKARRSYRHAAVSDLTPEGYRFVRYSHSGWIQRLYKDEGAKKEDAYLSNCYDKFGAWKM